MSRKGEFLLRKQRERFDKVTDQAAADKNACDAIRRDLFEQQRNFVDDPFRRKTLLCPRRAGKTHTCVAHSLITALENPGCVVVIVAMSLKRASQLYWEPFRDFSEKYHLGLDPRVGERTVYLPNGSKIWLAGCESLSDADKLRGGAYKLVIVDECAAIKDELFRYLIFEVVFPATNDVTGSTALIGTPGKFLSGLFFEATYPGHIADDGYLGTIDYYNPEPFWDDPPASVSGEPRQPQWRRHYWTVAENVYRPDIWKNALEIRDSFGYDDDNPIWIRENLGRWVSTADTMVYALADIIARDGGVHRARALWHPSDFKALKANKHGLPMNARGVDDWRYILGMDLGFEDSSAFVVVAYSPTHPTLYQVYEYKEDHLIVAQVARVIKQILEQFDNRIDSMVADMGAQGKQLVESINQMYGYFIEPAMKTAKFDHIELLNSDLYEGRLKVLRGGRLHDEWTNLQWDFRGRNRKTAIRTGRLREDPRVDNHLSDAMLYTWRYAYHHYAREAAVPVEKDTRAFWDSLDEQEAAEYVAERLKKGQLHTAVPASEDPWADAAPGFGIDNPWGKLLN